MNLDQQVNNQFNPSYYGQTGLAGCSTPNGYDYYHPHEAMKILGQQYANPSMSAKLTKVAELFELDVLSEDEALKACKVIIEQHKKVIFGPGMTVKI